MREAIIDHQRKSEVIRLVIVRRSFSLASSAAAVDAHVVVATATVDAAAGAVADDAIGAAAAAAAAVVGARDGAPRAVVGACDGAARAVAGARDGAALRGALVSALVGAAVGADGDAVAPDERLPLVLPFSTGCTRVAASARAAACVAAGT